MAHRPTLSCCSIAPSDERSITDVYSLGKIAFVALLGSVTLEASKGSFPQNLVSHTSLALERVCS